MGRMVLSWKLLEVLTKEGIGTKEVERMAWQRSCNRAAKLGYRMKDFKKGVYEGVLRRDTKHVRIEMEARTRQAKEDWQNVRRQFHNLRKSLLDKAVCPRDINNVKHEVDKIYKENEKEFVKGRLEQQEKLSHLKNGVKRSQPQNTERVMRE